MIQDKPECIECQYYNPKECFCDAIGGCVKYPVSVNEQSGRMKIDDRYCTSVWADEHTYVHDADYRDYIVKHIQNELAKPLVAALCTKDAIVAIKGDSTTRKDEYTPGVCCSQDIYVKELVQCKDCRYYRSCYCTYIYQMKIPHSRDFYCAWGERKEDEID